MGCYTYILSTMYATTSVYCMHGNAYIKYCTVPLACLFLTHSSVLAYMDPLQASPADDGLSLSTTMPTYVAAAREDLRSPPAVDRHFWVLRRRQNMYSKYKRL
jgi:hypothetical protein